MLRVTLGILTQSFHLHLQRARSAVINIALLRTSNSTMEDTMAVLVPSLETSAKEEDNVEAAFIEIVKKVLNKFDDSDDDATDSDASIDE